jgi:chromosome segregation ATPase
MSNMKMVSLIDAEAAEAKTEAREDLEHAASAIADEMMKIRSDIAKQATTFDATIAQLLQPICAELLKINNLIAEQKISIATLQYDFATLRFEVDELKRQRPIEPSRESTPC